MAQQLDHQRNKMDHEERCDVNDSVSKSAPNETSFRTITLDEHEDSEFHEGGIRGWATAIGA